MSKLGTSEYKEKSYTGGGSGIVLQESRQELLMICTNVRAVGVVRNIWKIKLIGFTDTLHVAWGEGAGGLEKSVMTPRFLTWATGRMELPWSEMRKLQEEQFWVRGWDRKFGLTMFEIPIRYLAAETNYNNILPVAALYSLLSFSTCIVSLIGKGLLFKHVIQWMDILKSPEDNNSRIGETSH